MRLAGSISWRFEENNTQLLHLALFVRDSVGLAIPSSADVPPPLTSDVPDLTRVLLAANESLQPLSG
jgi:hypothetical protein